MTSRKILPCILFTALSPLLACSKQTTSIEVQPSVSDHEAFQMLREAIINSAPLRVSESKTKSALECSKGDTDCVADDLYWVKGSKLQELLAGNYFVMKVPPARITTTYNFDSCRMKLIVVGHEGAVRSSRIGISDAGVCEFGPDVGTVCYAFFQFDETNRFKFRAVRGSSASSFVDVEKLIAHESKRSCK